jgi:Domain of unknown function (DUF1905)
VNFEFIGDVWVWPGEAAWHFVSLPKEYSEPIKDIANPSKGFGSVKVVVCINSVEWQTSIFPDKKSGCYLLPIKKEVRNKCGLAVSSRPQISIKI